MRNGMRYIFILCLFLGFASCQEDVLQPSYKGKGRLVLKDVDISAEASAETVTRATSTFTAPTASELTYKVTDTQTGEVVYNQTGEFTSLVLDEGFYRLEDHHHCGYKDHRHKHNYEKINGKRKGS